MNLALLMLLTTYPSPGLESRPQYKRAYNHVGSLAAILGLPMREPASHCLNSSDSSSMSKMLPDLRAGKALRSMALLSVVRCTPHSRLTSLIVFIGLIAQTIDDFSGPGYFILTYSNLLHLFIDIGRDARLNESSFNSFHVYRFRVIFPFDVNCPFHFVFSLFFLVPTWYILSIFYNGRIVKPF